jgi:hypothetical protein
MEIIGRIEEDGASSLSAPLRFPPVEPQSRLGKRRSRIVFIVRGIGEIGPGADTGSLSGCLGCDIQ